MWIGPWAIFAQYVDRALILLRILVLGTDLIEFLKFLFYFINVADTCALEIKIQLKLPSDVIRLLIHK